MIIIIILSGVSESDHNVVVCSLVNPDAKVKISHGSFLSDTEQWSHINMEPLYWKVVDIPGRCVDIRAIIFIFLTTRLSPGRVSKYMDSVTVLHLFGLLQNCFWSSVQ